MVTLLNTIYSPKSKRYIRKEDWKVMSDDLKKAKEAVIQILEELPEDNKDEEPVLVKELRNVIEKVKEIEEVKGDVEEDNEDRNETQNKDENKEKTQNKEEKKPKKKKKNKKNKANKKQ